MQFRYKHIFFMLLHYLIFIVNMLCLFRQGFSGIFLISLEFQHLLPRFRSGEPFKIAFLSHGCIVEHIHNRNSALLCVAANSGVQFLN